jgi:SPP1 gp7 family putative phage head morphogenesis protein
MGSQLNGVGLQAAIATTNELHKALLDLAGQPFSAAELLLRARRLIRRYEPLTSRALRDSLLAAWLKGARRVARVVPESQIAPPVLPPTFRPSTIEADEPIVRLPLIEHAAAALAGKQLVLPGEFAELDQDARRAAFTVARATSLETVEKVQGAIVADIREGGTLREFRRRLDDTLSPILSRPHVETLYRTQVAQAYAAGQQTVLDHPLVADEFPYLLWVATHDTRVREDHLAMETHGQDGTGVYRRDDPIWLTLWPPASYNCRCVVVPLSLEDAARHGSREARRWLESGQSPEAPEYAVSPYPLQVPAGWPASGRIGSIL